MNKINYAVIEDNGGGLYLAIYGKNGEMTHLFGGYEYRDETGTILNDVAFIDDADDFDNNILDETPEAAHQFTPEARRNGGWEIIADNDDIYPERMGAAGKREFGIRARTADECE